jgi:hypothetical protein
LTDGGGEVADAEFARGEGGNDPETGGVGERGEDVGNPTQRATDWERGSSTPHRLNVNDAVGAGKVSDIGELIDFARSGHPWRPPIEIVSHY